MAALLDFRIINADIVQKRVSLLSFGKDVDHKHLVKMVARRSFLVDLTAELWNAIDVSDLSTVRTFVVSSISPFLYEVDFLSRHEIVNPVSVDKFSSSFSDWGFSKGNSLYVTSVPNFRRSILTADALVAIPTYRFDFFADDIQSALSDGVAAFRVLEEVLESPVTGYSFKRYGCDDEIPCLEFSVAEAAKKMVQRQLPTFPVD